MKSIMELNLSIEEIYLIGQCTAVEKKEIMNELSGYLDNLDSDDQEMAELITRTLNKVKLLSNEELEEVKKYPREESEN